MAALKNEQTISELAARFEVHPTMFAARKKALLEGAAEIFDKGHKSPKHIDAQLDVLYRQIGRLKVERGFFAKSTQSLSRQQRKQMIDPQENVA